MKASEYDQTGESISHPSLHFSESDDDELRTGSRYFMNSETNLSQHVKINKNTHEHSNEHVFPNSNTNNHLSFHENNVQNLQKINNFNPGFASDSESDSDENESACPNLDNIKGVQSQSILKRNGVITSDIKPDSQFDSPNALKKVHFDNAKLEVPELHSLAVEKAKVAPVEVSMEISITGYVIKNVLFQHVKYIISVTKKGNSKVMKIYRRYSEFVKLREILMNKYPSVYLPPLPEKQLFGIRDLGLVEFRKKFLQIFMHELQYVVYYFDDSIEIKSFLDPELEDFPPSSVQWLKVTDALRLNLIKVLPVLQEFVKIARMTLWNNFHFLNNHLCCDETRNCLPPDENIIQIIQKSYDKKKLVSNLEKIKIFNQHLEHQGQFISDVHLVTEHIVKQYKECNKAETQFYEHLLEFQNDYIFKMNPGATEDTFSAIGKKLKSRFESWAKEKSLYVMRKNISDWIYREKNLIGAYTESMTSLDPFVEKLLEMKHEIEKDELNSQKNKPDEYYDQKHTAYQLLKEIITLNSIYLHDVCIKRYQYCRFQLYYNAMRFSIQKSAVHSECVMSIIRLIENLTKEMEKQLDVSDILKRYKKP